MERVRGIVILCVGLCASVVMAEIEPMWMDYLGGTDYDYGSGIAVDSAGRSYVTGETRNTSNFVGAINSNHGGRDAFVSCVDPDGKILWTAYVGGAGNDSGTKIVVDASGVIYLCGFTASLDLENATNAYRGGSTDAFVAAINGDGTLRWSCYLGGEKTDRANGIAVDPLSGDLIVAGYTESWQFSAAVNNYNGGAFDGFVARVSKDGLLKEARYFGGAYSDSCEAVAVNSAGTIFLAGTTYLSDLPGALNTRMGGDDAFLASMTADGQLRWSRYFGGTGGDRAYDLAIDPAGRILITGYTESKDIPGAINTSGGLSDAFVASCNDDGTQNFILYVGGSQNDRAYGIAVDRFSNIVITGSTNSTDLPVPGNGAMAGQNAFLAVLNDEGTLVMTGYLGGSLDDIGLDAAMNANGDILITGSTTSYLFAGGLNAFYGGSRDSFLVKLPAIDLAYADLLVNIAVDSVTAEQGKTASVPIRIDNAGRADATAYGPGYFTTTLKLADAQDADWATAKIVGTFKLASLATGDSLATTIEFATPTKVGRYYLRAQTDTEDTVPEQHEQNNDSRVVALDVTEPPKKPDLTIRKGTTSYTADPGQTLTVTVAVENRGQADAVSAGGGQFLTKLLMSDDPNDWSAATEPVEPYPLAMLGIGAIHDIDFQITAPNLPGQYYLRAQTDSSFLIEESNETNNTGATITLTVRTPKALPDLTIPGDGAIPLLYAPGEQVQFLFDSQNLADANAVSPDAAGILTTLYLANHPGVNWDQVTNVVGQTRIGALKGGQIRYRDAIAFTVPTQPGQYRLRAKIDSVNRVAESNESNNWGPMITLQVDAAHLFADLLAVFPDTDDITVRPGQVFEVPLEIQNRGSASAIPQGVNYFDTALALSTDPAADWDALPSVGTYRLYFLDPLERRTVSVALTAPEMEGTYWLRARTDVNGAVVEGNEDNWSSAVRLIVNGQQVVNHPPLLDPIGDRTVAENSELRLTLHATDPDGDRLTYSASPLPRRASLTGNVFSWAPDYDQAGSYTITFTAKDAEFEDSETITILVTNTNRAPVLGPIGPRTLDENQPLEFTVTATDPDGDTVSLSVQNLPAGASFADRMFRWTPGYDQAGNYAVSITASDGQAANSQAVEIVTITVRNVNRAPSAEAGIDQTVTDSDSNGTERVSLNGSGSDPDGDVLSYSWMDNLGDMIPAGATPSAALRVGVHTITLTVRDGGGLTSSDTVTVRVNEGPKLPQAPVLAPIGNKTIAENQTLSFTVQATDIDGDAISYSADPLPIGAVMAGRTFTWTPGFDQSGPHVVTFRARDATLEDSETITITVTNANRRPTAEAGVDQTMTDSDSNGSEPISLNGLASSDPDGDALSYSWIDNFGDTIPAGATPSAALRVGIHTITLTVHDSGGLASSDTLTVTVHEGPKLPQAPVLAPIGNKTVAENQTLSFTVQATDADGDAIVYSAQGLPPSAKFDPQTGQFVWQPWYEDAGMVPISFVAEAGGQQDTETIAVTVEDTPLSSWYNHWLQRQGMILGDQAGRQFFGDVSDLAVSEGQRILLTLGPADRLVRFSVQSLPRGASVIGNTFIWSTEYDQAGTYTLTFSADCGKIHQSRTVRVTVINVPLSDPGRRWLDRLDKP
jgi:PKD repeat protein